VATLTEAQRDLYELVGRCLREAFGEEAEVTAGESTYRVAGGPYGVKVAASPIGHDQAVVELYTWLARGLEITPDVARYLLETNACLRFGSLGLDSDGCLLLVHSLFPEQVDAVALARVITLLGATADEVEHELTERF
jgi:hypothetical protein